jgi:hypothetical protein
MLYLVFGIDSQQFAGGTIKFIFDTEHVYSILRLSAVSIFAMFLAFVTPIKFVFPDHRINRKGVQAGFYIFAIPLLLFVFYKVTTSGFNYGIMATEREKYNFLIELRVIPYLLFIQHASQRHISTSLFFKIIAIVALFSLIFFQARSILFEIFLIIACLHFRQTGDNFRLKYYLVPFLLIPISNISVAIRSGYTFDRYVEEAFKFEYLIIFNNIVAASFEYSMQDKLSWVMERASLMLPSPLRSILGMGNPSNNMFLDVSSSANLTAGGFSYLANAYIIFGYYSFVFLYVIYLILEIFRRNFIRYKVDNYLAYAFPIILSYFILAIRNDMGVLVKQLLQIIMLALIMNLVSRMRYR